jgi:phage-related protein
MLMIRRYSYSGISFMLTDNDTVVSTPMQSFMLKPSRSFFWQRPITIRRMIEIGAIRSLSDLMTYTGHRVTFVPTKEEWAEKRDES